jgi:hypothetical protein
MIRPVFCLLVVLSCGRRDARTPALQTRLSSAAPAPMAPLRATVWPDPSLALPANVAWISLSLSSPVSRERLERGLRLQEDEIPIEARWILAAAGPQVDGGIMWGPFSDPRCSTAEAPRLCVGHRYTLWLDGDELETFEVGPEAVVGPFWTGPGSVEVSDNAARLTRPSDLPCVVSALELSVPAPPQTVFDVPHGALVRGLTPDTAYNWSFVCTDAAGFSSPRWSVSLRTLPAQNVRLSEVVVDPRFDWNDSQKGDADLGVPFDGTAAASERASPTDEWVELWNTGAGEVDISGYVVFVEDGTPSEMRVGDAIANKQVFAPDGAPVLPAGGRFVMRLSPSSHNASNAATVVLRDRLFVERDRVALGQGGPDGDATSQDDEAVFACGDETVRAWIKGRATPGEENACF